MKSLFCKGAAAAGRGRAHNALVQHADYGPALPGMNWVPAPRYLLRRDRILRIFGDLAPGRVLEIGCGPGALLHELGRQGFSGTGVDRSAEARALAEAFHPAGGAFVITAAPDATEAGRYDYVCAFEVLEHIEDDLDALRAWRTYLRAPGGRLLLSVPAHPHRWNAADEWAGHVRRYGRQELVEKVEEAGFVVERVECYGFPLANVLEFLGAPVYRRKLEAQAHASLAFERTEASGVDRKTHRKFWPIYASWPFVWGMRLCCLVQRWFLSSDLGNGYLLVARRP